MKVRNVLFATTIVLAAAACREDSADRAAEDVTERAGEVGEGVRELGEDLGQQAERAGGEAEEAARGLAQDVEGAAERAGGELGEAGREVDQRAGEAAQDLRGETGRLAGEQAELSGAQAEFATQRDQTIQALRAEHAVFATQAALARGLLTDPTMSEVARQNATDKVVELEQQLDRARQAIDALAVATAPQWESARGQAEQQLDRLERAHRAAFDALSIRRETVSGT